MLGPSHYSIYLPTFTISSIINYISVFHHLITCSLNLLEILRVDSDISFLLIFYYLFFQFSISFII